MHVCMYVCMHACMYVICIRICVYHSIKKIYHMSKRWHVAACRKQQSLDVLYSFFFDTPQDS